MVRLLLAMMLSIVASGMAARDQATTQPPDGIYSFIETPKTGWRGILNEASSPGTAQINAVREKLTRAGEMGFGVQLVSSRSLSLGMLLKRDGTGPRVYRLVASASDTELLKQLNEAGAQGFRLVPNGAKIFNQHQERYKERWVAVLVQHTSGRPIHVCGAVKGTHESAEKALTEARDRGALVIASFGHPFGDRLVVILEEVQGKVLAAGASSGRQYKILSADRTSTVEKEVQERAAEGFRVIGAGALTVVMEREPITTASRMNYRLIATQRLGTLGRELSAVGAEGFRIVALADHPNESVVLLERAPDNTSRIEYSVVTLSADAAGRALARGEADGYRPVALIHNEVILERSAR